jgi:hypothetical protein
MLWSVLQVAEEALVAGPGSSSAHKTAGGVNAEEVTLTAGAQEVQIYASTAARLSDRLSCNHVY